MMMLLLAAVLAPQSKKAVEDGFHQWRQFALVVQVSALSDALGLHQQTALPFKA